MSVVCDMDMSDVIKNLVCLCMVGTHSLLYFTIPMLIDFTVPHCALAKCSTKLIILRFQVHQS